MVVTLNILVTQLAKEMQIDENKLLEWLRHNQYFFNDKFRNMKPTPYSINSGWFQLEEKTVGNKITFRTMVTPSGKDYLDSRLEKLTQK